MRAVVLIGYVVRKAAVLYRLNSFVPLNTSRASSTL